MPKLCSNKIQNYKATVTGTNSMNNSIILTTDKISFLKDKLKQLNNAAASNKLRTTWNLVDEINGKRRYNSATKIRKNNGTKLNSIIEFIEEWKHYFEDLLNINSSTSPTTQTIAPTLEDLPTNQGSITVNEVLEAV